MGRSPGSGLTPGIGTEPAPSKIVGSATSLPLTRRMPAFFTALAKRAEARQRQVLGMGEAGLSQRRIAVADEDQAALQGALAASGALAALEDARLEAAVPAELLEVRGRREELRVRGQDPRVGAGIRVDEAVRVRVGVVDVGAGRATDRVHLVLEDPAQAVARDAPSWPPAALPSRATGVDPPSRTPCEEADSAPVARSATVARVPARARKLATLRR